jgi:hypothetical protein
VGGVSRVRHDPVSPRALRTLGHAPQIMASQKVAIWQCRNEDCPLSAMVYVAWSGGDSTLPLESQRPKVFNALRILFLSAEFPKLSGCLALVRVVEGHESILLIKE